MYAADKKITFNGNYCYVFRVEHSVYNLGPYRANISRSLMLDAKMIETMQELNNEHGSNWDWWPPIWCDEMPFNGSKYRNFDDMKNRNKGNIFCGCESINVLKIWFGEHLKALAKVGFVVKVYRVNREDVLRTCSGRQCAFVKPTFPNKILSIESIL